MLMTSISLETIPKGNGIMFSIQSAKKNKPPKNSLSNKPILRNEAEI